jgi:hypothetical protein
MTGRLQPGANLKSTTTPTPEVRYLTCGGRSVR